MTRHLCAVDVPLAVDRRREPLPIRSTAGTTTPRRRRLRAEAWRRVLRRIGFVPFSPGVGRMSLDRCGRKRFRDVTHVVNSKVKRQLSQFCDSRLPRSTFRNVPEHASMEPMAQVAPRVDDPRDRRPGGRLDRDRLARPQRPRATSRTRRATSSAGSSARTATRRTEARAACRPAAPAWSASSSRSSIPPTSRPSSPAPPRRSYERDLRIVLSPTGAPARPRGLAARPAARPDRRRADHPARGVERGARAAARPAATGSSSIDPLMPLDERIPSVSAAHTSGADQAMRHLLGARPPADRADHRPARLGGDRGPPARLPRGARGGGDPARIPRSRSRRLRDRPAARGRGAPARPPRAADRDLRVQRQHRDRRDPGGARARRCACRRTSRSSASTTSSTRRS